VLTTNNNSLLSADRVPLQAISNINVFGVKAMVVLVATIGGQGTSVDFWIDLL
jgi:hypothetical protein